MSLAAYFQPVVYVKLEPDLVTVREVRSGRTISEPPVAAISRESKKRLLGVGEAAKAAATTHAADIVNPFKNPRSLISDFTVAEVVLKGLIRKLFDGRFFVPSPKVVLHPQIVPEGGFTQVEIRALRELAMGAGASKAVVWHGRELRDDELLEWKFDSGGKVLN